MEGGHGLKYFSGDDADHREYLRWKNWTMNKMRVMDKPAKESRGSFVWTLLQGRALEVVEHLAPEDYQKEGGDQVIFDLLDARWPQKERTDELGENVSAVFLLKAAEGENVRTWCARARETFDRCNRKTGVDFSSDARGWLLLKCSGMTEEQRAVILARTRGSLKFDDISQSMRSCFPDYVVARRKAAGAHYLEADDDGWWDGYTVPENAAEDEAGGFDDVELFLAEHDNEGQDQGGEAYTEDDVAEVLAATWKDRRQELNRLQRSRKFHEAKDLKRSFRIEVEELKRRTKCHRCGKVGHWSRECREKAASSSSGSHLRSGTNGAGLVQANRTLSATWRRRHVVENDNTVLALRNRMDHPVHLVSSPQDMPSSTPDAARASLVSGPWAKARFRRKWSRCR